jgi:hypothetical protein
MTPQTAEERKAYNRRWYLAHRAGSAVEISPDIEAEAQAAREAEIETHTVRIATQLQQLPVNVWMKVATASSLGVAIAVAVQLDHRWQRDGRTLIRCDNRDCDLFVLRQGTVTQ